MIIISTKRGCDAPKLIFFSPAPYPAPMFAPMFYTPPSPPPTAHRYMPLFPPTARLRYCFDLYWKGGATHALLDQTMICGQSIAAMTREVAQVCVCFFFKSGGRSCNHERICVRT